MTVFFKRSAGVTFSLDRKIDEKDQARHKLNELSFHPENIFYLTSFAHIRVTHFSSNIPITSNTGSVLSYIWRLFFSKKTLRYFAELLII